MTSSLVGSEMCIRDRFVEELKFLHLAVPVEVLVDLLVLPWELATNEAVSYTHLTLPTICSV
eukprot:8927162-Prorocentrum_lima.AAC.1